MNEIEVKVGLGKKCLWASSKVPNIPKAVSELVNFIVSRVKIDVYPIEFVLNEAIANAIVHGNKSDPRKQIFAMALVKPERLILKVVDEGRGFDYDQQPDPTKKENLLLEEGRGIFLIQHFMDEVTFNKLGNAITMTKDLKRL